MLKIKASHLILLLILILGFSLRVYKLSEHPSGLTWDEAALGYNAFSILKTAHDEHGAFLPLVFKSFGDYKPGLYVYATVPTVAIFGLNEFSTRLPSVIFGVLAILGIYLLTNLLSPLTTNYQLLTTNTKAGNTSKQSLGLLAALLLAISPWHIYFSRGAWEVNVYVTLLTFTIYFLIKSLTKGFPLWPSIITAVATLFTYQAAKMLTPLVVLSVLLVYIEPTKKIIFSLIKGKRPIDSLIISVSLVIVIWYALANLTGPAGNRLNRLSLFNYRPELSAETIKIDSANKFTLSLYHNITDGQLRSLASRYLYHFSPEVLFYEGPVVSVRGHIPRLGMLYLADSVLLILGIFALAKSSSSHAKKVLFLLLVIAPIPASMTLSEFSTFRAEFLVVPLMILGALGLRQVLSRVWALPFVLLYAFNVVYGLDIYFNHSQNVFAKEYNAGYKEVFTKVKQFPANRVVVTDVYGQPYIFYLFYNQIDPTFYQQNKDFIDGGLDVGRVGRLGNIEFNQFYLYNHELSPNTFFAGTQGNIPDNYNYDRPDIEYYGQVNYPDGQPMFRIIKSY